MAQVLQLFPQKRAANPNDAKFEQWWGHYRLHKAKKAARAAFERAIGKATLEELIAGAERYAAQKPAWQQWAHPATWLNGERWLDEPEIPARRSDQPGLVPISRGSDEWAAWVRSGHKDTLVLYAPQYGPLGGWSFPSRWPATEGSKDELAGKPKIPQGRRSD